ncbi:MAG: hypothetical protein KI785_12030 [Devosiaceae bacterium]|nr:hypothetical protein [Devosiaceae bacterium MH13]
MSHEAGCTRQPMDGDCYVSDLQLTADEEMVLRIARIFFHSFTQPASQAWVPAFAQAEETFGSDQGLIIAGRTLNTLKAIRRLRRSLFMFNSPSCPGCSRIATEQERRMMIALALVRLGDLERAEAELVLLCESQSVRPALDAVVTLSTALHPPVTRQSTFAHPAHSVLQ